MSEETENKTAETTSGDEKAGEQKSDAIQVGILGQYIKDLSFENPTPAQTLQKLANEKPSMDINVNLNARQLGEEVFEVDLKISATAKTGEDTAFVVELVYSGLFGAKNVPQQALQPFLMIEAPRMLFPFARRIIADATRDGGFPPLMLEPIDFASLYARQVQNAKGDAQTPTENITVN
ncbi:protein-export chaperone SecB [Luteithermobacter gelatinilyticus]|uniref:protein-export chaperone SecB n=1 Tax=Luteithermobacter gelatinilyticus TaxID=2582913 RepID=UPI001105BF1E|nr:protein-export chaperone SecB [Luteithermobacter gelatinilyticus]|tara:strand:+ start:4152 stop:4688 length:537 start_codon:yes stop_codon:yes gene_type:complete